jgi:hypothetical protein
MLGKTVVLDRYQTGAGSAAVVPAEGEIPRDEEPNPRTFLTSITYSI